MKYELLWHSLLTFLRSQRVVYVITAALAVALLYSLLQLLWVLWPKPVPAVADPLLTAKIQPVADVAGWHLFGKYNAVRAGLVPTTQLNLSLKGIFYSNQPQQSQALITAPGLAVKVYMTGAELPGGARIKEILQDSVIIEHNNELQKLPLKQSKLQFAPRPQGLGAIKE